jgi:hypothetical protein
MATMTSTKDTPTKNAQDTVEEEPVDLEDSKAIEVFLNTRGFLLDHGATAKDFAAARSAIFDEGIWSCFDKGRAILNAFPRKRGVDMSVYAQECNGLILDMAKDYRHIMVPPRNMRIDIDDEPSNEFLAEGHYNIYEAQDGTTFGMYYYQGRWCISTGRGYEMNEAKWETKTYQALIEECLEAIGLTWVEFLAGLDQTRCYTFGFHHNECHPFRAGQKDPRKLWFIQNVNLDPTSPTYLWEFNRSPHAKILPQTQVKAGTIKSMRDLYDLAVTALDTYQKTGVPLYGFILRSTSVEKTGPHSDLFVESRLMKAIRQTWYYNRLVRQANENKWMKSTAMSLNASLNGDLYANFRVLFPEYDDHMETYQGMYDRVAESMTDMGLGVDGKLDEADPVATLVHVTAQRLFNSFHANISFQAKSKNRAILTRAYREYFHSPDLLEHFMSLAQALLDARAKNLAKKDE